PPSLHGAGNAFPVPRSASACAQARNVQRSSLGLLDEALCREATKDVRCAPVWWLERLASRWQLFHVGAVHLQRDWPPVNTKRGAGALHDVVNVRQGVDCFDVVELDWTLFDHKPHVLLGPLLTPGLERAGLEDCIKQLQELFADELESKANQVIRWV